jgi:hypothetical protein
VGQARYFEEVIIFIDSRVKLAYRVIVELCALGRDTFISLLKEMGFISVFPSYCK